MSDAMWAAQLVAPNQALRVTRVPIPTPGPGELLLKLEASGICHTDLHTAHGSEFPHGAPQPLTLGHEGIGRVAKAGHGTTTPVGVRLGAPWLHESCEHCRSCVDGWESFCAEQRAHGYTVNGTFAEYVIVKERYAARIPDALASLAAAPLMCAGVTAYSGIARAGLERGRTAVIVGCGGLGQYAVQLAKLRGATVIAIDTSQTKVDQAIALGADAGFVAGSDTAAKVKALGGADAVLNFAPSNAIWPMVTGMVNTFATIVSVAMVAEPVPLVLEWLTYNGVNITGTSVGTRKQLQELLDIADTHELSIDIEAVRLADINPSMERVARGEVRGRLVVDFT